MKFSCMTLMRLMDITVGGPDYLLRVDYLLVRVYSPHRHVTGMRRY